MSIHVENTLQKTNKKAFEQRAHYVPCKVEEDGSANVKKYFEPYIVEENDGNKTFLLQFSYISIKNMYSESINRISIIFFRIDCLFSGSPLGRQKN